MGRPFLEFLDNSSRQYCCKLCHRTIANADAVVSKDFHSKHGRAYLLRHAVNVSSGPAEDRMMTSGLHTVCDIHCTGCLYKLGWKYLVAFETSQKYKEGKFILERVKVEVVSAEEAAGRGPTSEAAATATTTAASAAASSRRRHTTRHSSDDEDDEGEDGGGGSSGSDAAAGVASVAPALASEAQPRFRIRLSGGVIGNGGGRDSGGGGGGRDGGFRYGGSGGVYGGGGYGGGGYGGGGYGGHGGVGYDGGRQAGGGRDGRGGGGGGDGVLRVGVRGGGGGGADSALRRLLRYNGGHDDARRDYYCSTDSGDDL